MLITFRPVTVDAIQWTGTNDDDVTEHLGTSEWRRISGTDTLPDWWLYVESGRVCAMSDEMRRTRTEEAR